jgi:hypothetical protein
LQDRLVLGLACLQVALEQGLSTDIQNAGSVFAVG